MEKSDIIKKVLIFSVAYQPFVAEAETAVREITDRIKDAEFHMLTVNLDGKQKKYEKIGNIHIYRIGRGVFDRYLFPFISIPKALSLHRKYEFSLVWSIMASYAGFAGLFFKILKPKIHFILTLQESNSVGHIRRRARYVFPLFKLIFMRADSIQAISNYLADFSVSMGFEKKPTVVANGINLSLFTTPIDDEDRKKTRDELGLLNTDTALITTSKLVIKNGIGDLIKALPLLPQNIKLFVFSDGELKRELMLLSKNLALDKRVFFKGTVPQDQIPKYLKSCDIFIHPAIAEGFGNSILESFAARVPVVATFVGGIADLLDDGKNAYVSEPENPNSIARAIETAIHDEHMKDILNNAYSFAVQKNDWKGIAMQMKENFGIPIHVAVVGGGIFGGTTAVQLGKNGLKVSLFEKENELLQAASGINQYRLHRGYHYPRSISTALSSKVSEESFLDEYRDAVIKNVEHYYCIAKEKSKISKEQFLEFCDKCGLEYEIENLGCINKGSVQLIIKGKESLIDPVQLREVLKNHLRSMGVHVYLSHTFIKDEAKNFDFVINCTYANLNSILEDESSAKKEYQFELCEKPILKLPGIFKGKSIVILDGPFMCIDPYADSGFHVMGNVVHAIHATNIGPFPVIPDEFLPLMNKGIIKNPPITNINKFIESASYFMPEIAHAEHIGSMFTMRTVLPNVDSTDERPTLVSRVNEDIINVFSGKIGNCVQASEQVMTIIKTH